MTHLFMAPISATVLTFNEASHIEECITSLKDIADEIIVVDSFSNDGTPEICERLGCKVTRRKMVGYGAQRQYATSLTSYDYVISLDADEVISPALRTTLIELKKIGFKHRGYSFPRLNFYCGIPVKHCGWYPDMQVRLFDKRYANWNLNDVEERVIFSGNVQPIPLDGDILHYRCDTVEEFIETESKHAEFLSGELAAERKNIHPFKPLYEGIKSFFSCYINQGGIFDGYAGRKISKQRFHSVYKAYRNARTIIKANNNN